MDFEPAKLHVLGKMCNILAKKVAKLYDFRENVEFEGEKVDFQGYSPEKKEKTAKTGTLISFSLNTLWQL